MDFGLNNSPIKRARLFNEIKEKRKKLNPAGEQ
ncbi:hypothetical protein YPC_4542 [Yersinia pestis biovar Medievalis str. Harbin 35]|nr:hypothetical protein YPC_4542 [Yersinia pestis biovar Medievalis str. Harbin 35]EEO74577.1 hypothetical protein YP516_4178 [Yersinia pestis Nepal516]EEO83211.1 hypothetical protein YPF_0139 [Yersinia pestis biovar Orientalis str. India 195]EEO86148.1 hypothetical protein YPH_2052 [Yersinia pestis biovar Orientalis str. PEXU2]EEO92705.1 hypothetical protein YPS_0140 [Yersinia pestis Pestoides A]